MGDFLSTGQKMSFIIQLREVKYYYPCKYCGKDVERLVRVALRDGFTCVLCKEILRKKAQVERLTKEINRRMKPIIKLEDRITKIVATIK